MPSPRFSVIITCHNQREFVADAVESALALSSHDREIIVVDDASTDGSREILARYHDTAQLVLLQTNQGRGGARNRGAAVANGDYIVFLDGDDAFLPWALHVYERVARARNPRLILSPMRWFTGPLPGLERDVEPHDIRMVEYPDYLRKDRPVGVSASSLVVDRHSFFEVRGWAEDLAVMEDQDLVLRLCESGPVVQILSPPTTFHRKHPAQIVNQVPPFVGALHDIISRERQGQYPGGNPRRRERRAVLGALVFYWARQAFNRGFLLDALRLTAGHVFMVSMAMIFRLRAVLTGRRQAEVLDW